ncbi:leucine-rich repeat-containing protein 59 isoform X1 [Apis mellifera caucasica]|uniref:Leucine-rich repeat-containing protein 59 isoform X1 n=1 Tax=Apis mellifera TaxID=7460 RepID=A0A7M7H1Q5_APIME|nr:leucine-rich repeat-containing protein 59 isoform X1 [Apis mellifera]KAG6797613.1 leucine-rich repeat-containing protein 59 isoform X1 [Apis mellifera caucasica]KAG9437462.1 leucine-rich repeat-containing protein 59 isoform X1 [Apis mellifera carnica]|eukprot:XP_006568633.1 leucine-rich repeat-containing protein 59 isoform X1 [Apis mellifera]
MNLKNVKNRLKDETLDLSLCDLKEVPVREIATIKKATILDLSNNLLTFLPNTFVDLKQIIKLDLSKNMLTEIPENFGELRQLKHLDLYANQISRLPLSLSELKNLRWLDLKENPLTLAVASVAGPCSNLSECQACARNIVSYLSYVKVTIEEEKLRRLNATVTVDTETDTISTKKGGKRKKKKLEKNNKQNLDKNGFNLLNKVKKIDENKIEPPKLTLNNQINKEYGFKENVYQFFMSMILWVFLLGLIFTLMITILPLYSKQSELFINYIETNTGVSLKEFQKYSTNILYSLKKFVINICDNLYFIYEQNFKTDISMK